MTCARASTGRRWDGLSQDRFEGGCEWSCAAAGSADWAQPVVVRLVFAFSDLHPDAPELPGDLDWLLRFVAGTFEVRVGESLVFDEIDFPVLDLAHALDGWMAADLAARRDLNYEVPGGSPEALAIRCSHDGWTIDSTHRPAKERGPRPLSDADVRAGVRRFIDELTLETRRLYDYDVQALLRRVAAGAHA